MTQEELAEKARLDDKHVQAVELAATNPTLATLVGLARGLGITLADLFDDG
jgi:transcriptional regulator with XRE-family HTH domain